MASRKVVPPVLPPPYEEPNWAAGPSQQDADTAPLLATPFKDDEDESGRFALVQGYRDVWATIAFFVHFLLLIILTVTGFMVEVPPSDDDSSYTVRRSSDNSPPPSEQPNPFPKDVVVPSKTVIFGWLLLTIVVGWVVALHYLFALQRYAIRLVKGTFIFATAASSIVAVVLLIKGNAAAAIAPGIYAFIHVICFYMWRNRMPFAAVMLEKAATVTRKYPATVAAGFIGWNIESVYYIVMLVVGFAGWRLSRAVENHVAQYFIGFYLLFSMIWTSQVIKNTVHVTVSGVFATYYFLGVPDEEGNVTVTVRNPTAASAKRALSTSFGSICFGSLVIALVSPFRIIARSLRQNAQDQRSVALTLILCCLECILSMLESIINYINIYAFTQVAVYGKPYIQAAQDTWHLFQTRGLDVVINDDLTQSVLSFGALLCGAFTGGVACIYVAIATDGDVVWYAVGGILAWVIGIVEYTCLMQPMKAGIATTFVCWAEEPALMPQLSEYHRLQQRVDPLSMA